MRRLLLPAVLLALQAAPPGEAADGASGLDLTAVRARVDDGAAAGGSGAYRRLRDALRRAGRGLASDFSALRAVARACAGPLSGDGGLRGALAGALDEGETALRSRDAEAVAAAGLLAVPAHRDRVLARAARARDREGAGEAARDAEDESGAAANFRAAAAGFDRAERIAARLLDRETPRKPVFDVAVAGRGGALLGVWGDPVPDPEIVVVGADDGNGPQFLVLHPGAEGWVRIPVASSGDLWWVAGVPGDGVWTCGSEGRVFRYDPATGTLEDRSAGVDAILYGVWGSGPADVWAVGGDPAGLGPTPSLCHWDGQGWSEVAAPAATAGKSLFKVWGAAADDVWACGQSGILLHYDGSAWTSVDSGTSSVLLTVTGAEPLVAVGGGASAVAVERGGDGSWGTVPVTGANFGSGSQFPGPSQALNGVWVPATGTPLAVGFAGTVVRRTADGWVGVDGVPQAVRDLHAIWMDAEGNAVMVGGNLGSRTQGQIVTFGRRRLPAEVVDRARFRNEVADLLYSGCALSGCHLPPFPNASLAIDTPETTFANLVSIPSTQAPLLRVFPGRPSQSYLWHKLSGTQETVGGSGERMPAPHDSGDTYLTDAEMALVRGWILDGARDD